VRKKAQTLAKLLRHAGALATLLFFADKLLHRWTRARILLVYLREPELLARQDPMLPAGFAAQVRSPDALGKLADACAAELTVQFLTQARNNGDQCVAILEGDCVVSYQWLSDGLTWAYEDIWISFGPRYLYGYNSFTAPSHRGKHLNHSGVVIAAQALAVPKSKGLAGYIVASNVASILAHSRVSAKYSGVVLVWPHGSQGLYILASPGCRGAELQLVRRPSAPAAQRQQFSGRSAPFNG
jgi:hypothetical protein